MFNLHYSSFTVEYINLTRFASVQFIPNGVTPSRKNTVTIANPRLLIARKDGQTTIQGPTWATTRTFNMRDGLVVATDHNGVQSSATV